MADRPSRSLQVRRGCLHRAHVRSPRAARARKWRSGERRRSCARCVSATKNGGGKFRIAKGRSEERPFNRGTYGEDYGAGSVQAGPPLNPFAGAVVLRVAVAVPMVLLAMMKFATAVVSV